MNDDTEEVGDLGDYDPVTALAGPLMKKVLNEVALTRQKQDGEHGFFRDYANGTAGTLPMGPTISREREHASEMLRREGQGQKSGKVTWRHQLDVAHALVVVEGTDESLRKKLLELAALSVAWVEAIDRRQDEKRIERKVQRAKRGLWLSRLVDWIRVHIFRVRL